VTDVAHELRTPLTNLRCQVEALQDGLLAPDAVLLGSLHEEILLLSRLADDLQDLTLAEAGRLRLERTAVAVAPAIAAALAGTAAAAAERGVTLRSTAGDVPEVDADPARLGQILRNLLANALAHTPAGGTVTVGTEWSGDAVEIAVEDSGPGVAPEHLPHVFDRFYRADPARGGAGLGLAIVRQLALAHGGDARVESPPGRGARFVVRLKRPGF
jgi:two-component system, OmpR family, sensor histidine kinase BaeS